MARIIDNKGETLASILNQEFRDAEKISVATAYFNIRGWGAIKEGLQGKPLRLLLGREPTESIKWEDEVLKELEESEDNPDYFSLLLEAVDFFSSPDVEVRLLEGPFFHGKCFLGVVPENGKVRRGVAVVGSSNFTHGGLVQNRELNMLSTDREVVTELMQWFQEMWDCARDYKQEFLRILSNYTTTWSPMEVLAKALYETYKDSLEEAEIRSELLKKIYPHQLVSLTEARMKLQRFHGVVVADSTGLGKTRVALGIARDYLPRRVLVIAPKAVLETTWKDEMRKMNIHLESVNSERLSQDPDAVVKEYSDPENPVELVIVDEAHQFRHQATNRYKALFELLLKNGADVLLLTATPINTSLMDLYALLSLYLSEDSIGETGLTLRGYFTSKQKEWLEGRPVEMDEILRKFVVRISRDLARELAKEKGIELKFPERKLRTVRYDLNLDLEQIVHVLEEMNLACYDLSIEKIPKELRLPDGTPVPEFVEPEKREKLKQLVKEVIKINLLKRLESSLYAFRQSLERLKEYLERAIEYAKRKGVFVPPRIKGELVRLVEDEEEALPEPEELFRRYPELLERCKLTVREIEDFINKSIQDMGSIKRLLSLLPPEDTKCLALEQEVRKIYPELKGKNGVIIFTLYADTAEYLYQKLKDFSPILITGRGGKDREGKGIEEADAVRIFQESGGIMVSTDVLSVGQNLQNAQYVVNYDFPWNPVILIQRAGRIDRIGSPYDKIYLMNMLPPEGDPSDSKSLEHFLALMSRLYQRLEAIRQTVGLDASVLGEEAIPKNFVLLVGKISGEDQSVIRLLEQQMEQFTRDPRDALVEILKERGLEWIKSLPSGIGAYKRGDREGLFVLFTDGKDVYWRLRYFDKPETRTDPTSIIEVLKGDENKGQRIDYQKLIERLRKVKEELLHELEESEARRRTREGIPIPSTKKAREIYTALARVDEKLAVMFRKLSGRKPLVDQLYRAMGVGKLVETARGLLPKQAGEEAPPATRDIRVKRICWCWISPSLGEVK
jgi:superfamily II DNA or RNA helicase